jgi:hypothetical protein
LTASGFGGGGGVGVGLGLGLGRRVGLGLGTAVGIGSGVGSAAAAWEKPVQTAAAVSTASRDRFMGATPGGGGAVQPKGATSDRMAE